MSSAFGSEALIAVEQLVMIHALVHVGTNLSRPSIISVIHHGFAVQIGWSAPSAASRDTPNTSADFGEWFEGNGAKSTKPSDYPPESAMPLGVSTDRQPALTSGWPASTISRLI